MNFPESDAHKSDQQSIDATSAVITHAAIQKRIADYNEARHAHNFACWCAAKAVQRALKNGTTASLISALKECGVRQVVEDTQACSTDEDGFDTKYKKWCNTLIRSAISQNIDLQYGVATKMIAIYLNVRIVMGGHSESAFATYAHSRFDSIHLSIISVDLSKVNSAFQNRIADIRWTHMVILNRKIGF